MQTDPVPAPLWRLRQGAAWRDVGGEVFVITEDRAFHRVRTASGADILRAIAAAPVTADSLAELVVARYAVDRPTAARDIERFLADLDRLGIAAITAVEAGPGAPGAPRAG